MVARNSDGSRRIAPINQVRRPVTFFAPTLTPVQLLSPRNPYCNNDNPDSHSCSIGSDSYQRALKRLPQLAHLRLPKPLAHSLRPRVEFFPNERQIIPNLRAGTESWCH